MSAETMKHILDAISEHVKDSDAVLTDWVVAFATMERSADSSTGIAYGTDYVSSDSSPQSVVGVVKLVSQRIIDDVAHEGTDCDCE